MKLLQAAVRLWVCFPHRVPGLRKEQVLPLVQPQYGSLEARQLLHTHTHTHTIENIKLEKKKNADLILTANFDHFPRKKLGESHL